jgi:hypothetical protein
MWQLFPPFSSQETSADNVINLFLGLDNSIKLRFFSFLYSTIFKLALNVGVEHFDPFNEGFEIDIRGLGMLQ